jgi:aconitase B
MSADIYRYLNFNEIESFQKSADSALIPAVNMVEVG